MQGYNSYLIIAVLCLISSAIFGANNQNPPVLNPNIPNQIPDVVAFRVVNGHIETHTYPGRETRRANASKRKIEKSQLEDAELQRKIKKTAMSVAVGIGLGFTLDRSINMFKKTKDGCHLAIAGCALGTALATVGGDAVWPMLFSMLFSDYATEYFLK